MSAGRRRHHMTAAAALHRPTHRHAHTPTHDTHSIQPTTRTKHYHRARARALTRIRTHIHTHTPRPQEGQRLFRFVGAGLFVTSRDEQRWECRGQCRVSPTQGRIYSNSVRCLPPTTCCLLTFSRRPATRRSSAPWLWTPPPCPRRSLRCAVATISAGVISWRRLTRSANSWTGLSQMTNVQRWATLCAESVALNRWEGCFHQQRRGPVRSRLTELAVWRTGCSFCGAVSLSSRTCAAKRSTRAAARCEC